MAIAVSISLKNGLAHVLGDGMGGEEEDDLLPLALVGEILSQRLSDVVREGLDEAGVRSPTVDEAPLHRRRAAADRRKGYGYVIEGLYVQRSTKRWTCSAKQQPGRARQKLLVT